MTDPQDDVPCRSCGALTQHATEICDDCRTPAGRLVTAMASAAASIVHGHRLRPAPVTVADVIAGEAVSALRSIATIIGCPANADPLTDLDGLVMMVRALADRAETVRAVTAHRDALLAEIDARGPAILVTR